MKQNELQYGGLMFAGFIAFFFVMKGLGLYTNVNFRSLNVLIHMTFVFLAMKDFRRKKEGEFDYLKTMAVGIRTSVYAVIGFALFQGIYLEFLDPAFFVYVKENAIMGSLLTPLNASIWLVMEGLGVTILTSYLGMRYLTYLEKVPPLT